MGVGSFIRITRLQPESLQYLQKVFEMMVDEVRSSCMTLMGPNPFDDRLPLIAFHHGAMTAKPLIDIMRAMIAQLAKRDDTIDDDERPIFKGVLTQLAREYGDLVNMRNNLLHGTWFIGYSSVDDPDAAEFYVRKQTSTRWPRITGPS
jgi:hypothetical protein